MQNFFFYTIRLVDIGNEACIRRHFNVFVIQIIVKSRHHIDLQSIQKAPQNK